MVREEELESFPYDEGEIDELKERALTLSGFMFAKKDWEDKIIEIAKNVSESENKKEIVGAIRLFCHMLLKEDGVNWIELYQALFENVLYCQENHYFPENKEDEEETVKKCIREKKRIRTDIEEGANP